MPEVKPELSKTARFQGEFSAQERRKIWRLQKDLNQLHSPENHLTSDQVEALRLEMPTVKTERKQNHC